MSHGAKVKKMQVSSQQPTQTHLKFKKCGRQKIDEMEEEKTKPMWLQRFFRVVFCKIEGEMCEE
jgi:hypothetical protein